ncbi:ABC transporter ATP-binding protein [Bosea sp. F3-2]|uniref:ABC transporter ATP-binding protein n=1 Tax=Bosea sp. F3-2 TaxID=2599640 RepID=UPI0011F00A09|nr:ABC transporter ATP-binding protein [Bosea sp. F3-2]QEL22904.1 ABC transporter ATP-binding protein [Bosea sp. F3-2]
MQAIDRQEGRAIRGADLSITNLYKRYGTVDAVRGIDCAINPGEFMSLLGPSGSGKTTLLMMLAGFETVTSGAITMAGHDLTNVPPNKRGIGMVFQRYALFPHLTVAQNIAFPLRMRGLGKDETRDRVARTLGMVRLEGYGDRLPQQLSGGQQQRVAVARAIVFEPPVLLMDEPLGALDKKLREDLQIEIKRLHRDLGLTIVYVTHDQEEALTLSDRIAVMNQGRIVQIGEPRGLYASPRSSFVANFLGKTNFIRGTISAVSDDHLAINTQSIELLVPRERYMGTGRAEIGQPVEISVRPESIEFVQDDPGALRGIVEGVVFVGAYTTYTVRFPDGSVVDVQSTGRDFLAEGEAVWLRLPSPLVTIFSERAE